MPDDKKKDAGQLYQALTLGFVFPVSTVVGYGIGYGLDKWLHTRPWLTIIFTVFGIGGAFVQLFRAGSDSNGQQQ